MKRRLCMLMEIVTCLIVIIIILRITINMGLIKRRRVLSLHNFLQIRSKSMYETSYLLKLIKAIKFENYTSIMRNIIGKDLMLHLTPIPCLPIVFLIVRREVFPVENTLKLTPRMRTSSRFQIHPPL